MKTATVSLTAFFFICLCSAQEERPEGISERLFSDSARMVEDSIYGNSIAGRYIVRNPERFREPLREFAASTEEPGLLISAAHLAFGILSDDEFFEIAEKALNSIPDSGGYPVEEARSGISALIQKKKAEIKERDERRIEPETHVSQNRKGGSALRSSIEEEAKGSDSPALPKWPLLLGTIAILAILLIRAIMRGRAS